MSERMQPTGGGDSIRLIENPETVENPLIAFFLDYWRMSRRGNHLPLYSSFVPKEVGNKLPWVVVADALPDLHDFRYRVIGQRVCDYFLGNSTGKTVREAFDTIEPSAGPLIVSIFRKTCLDRVPIRAMGPAMKLGGTFCPDYDTIYLPYSSNGVAADRVVNALFFNPSELIQRVMDEPPVKRASKIA